MRFEQNACAVRVHVAWKLKLMSMFGGVANDIRLDPDFEIVNARDKRGDMADIERLRLLKAHLSG
jgi:hypothetical protein